MGTELTGKTIPAEAGLVGRTVNFTKGCYTGQELVARGSTRAASNVARRLVGVVAPAGPADGEGGDALAAGHDAARGRGAPGRGAADDKVAGTITSAAWSAELGAWVALGYLHRTSRPRGRFGCARVTGSADRIRLGWSCCHWSGWQGPAPSPARDLTTDREDRCPRTNARPAGGGRAAVRRCAAYALGAAATSAFTLACDIVTAIPIVVFAGARRGVLAASTPAAIAGNAADVVAGAGAAATRGRAGTSGRASLPSLGGAVRRRRGVGVGRVRGTGVSGGAPEP